MRNPINNTVFDSRDLLNYLEQLEEDLLSNYNDFVEDNNEELEEENEDDENDYENDDENNTEKKNKKIERKGLEFADTIDEADLSLPEFYSQYSEKVDHYEVVKDFCNELESYCKDLKYGESIIADDYFEEYCEEVCEEFGYISKDFPSWIVIDWEATADNMKHDYTSVEFEGDTYWIRC